MSTSNELANKLRKWYDDGEKGMLTLCRNEQVPVAINNAIRRWYRLGRANMEAIAEDIEKL